MKILIPVSIGLISTITVNKIFSSSGMYKINYNNKPVPYSGGTIIYINTIIGFLAYYFIAGMSYIKLFFFIMILSVVYVIGMFEDILGNSNTIDTKKNAGYIFSRDFFVGIVSGILITGISCYMYYFFGEEYWLSKGIITFLASNLFNLFDSRPGRCIKSYYLFYLVMSFTYLQWTNELSVIFTIVITCYYFFDAYGYSMLGGSGSNFIGFVSGMAVSEVIGTNVYAIIVLLAVLVFLQIMLYSYSLTEFIEKVPLLDYFDRLLTERQGGDNTESRGRNGKRDII